MSSLTIRHVTTYRYRQPVAFGEHRMMLRPRDSHDQRVIEARLEISPEPRSASDVGSGFFIGVSEKVLVIIERVSVGPVSAMSSVTLRVV